MNSSPLYGAIPPGTVPSHFSPQLQFDRASMLRRATFYFARSCSFALPAGSPIVDFLAFF